jgi:hypothetical protein
VKYLAQSRASTNVTVATPAGFIFAVIFNWVSLRTDVQIPNTQIKIKNNFFIIFFCGRAAIF